MKDCNLCQGRGVRPIGLENHALCLCVVQELGALRAALLGAGLLPPDHWVRQMPVADAGGLEFVLLSRRRDGYRLVLNDGGELEARAPDGRVCWRVPNTQHGQPTLAQLERDIDREYPLDLV